MHMRDRGTGPAVLMLHGAPSPADDFGSMSEALCEAGMRALVPDLPGYGNSPAVEGDYSWERVLEVLEQSLLARGVRDVVAVGFSGGAHLALALAIRRRIHVRGVFAIAGFAAFDTAARAQMQQFVGMLRGGFDVASDDAKQIMIGRMLSPAFAASHPDAVRDVAAWAQLTTTDVLANELEAAMSADVRIGLRRLDVPVIAAVGDLDVACPVPFSREIAELAPRGALETRTGRGHALLLEDPDWCIATALALARVSYSNHNVE